MLYHMGLIAAPPSDEIWSLLTTVSKTMRGSERRIDYKSAKHSLFNMK